MRKEKDIDVQEIVNELPKDDQGRKEVLFFLKGFNLAKTSQVVNEQKRCDKEVLPRIEERGCWDGKNGKRGND